MRVRLVAAVVHLELVADDGEVLRPLEVGAVRVPAAEWPPDLDRLIGGVQRQLDENGEGAPQGASPTD